MTITTLEELLEGAHKLARSKGWWSYNDDIEREEIINEKLLLIHSELSEAVECWRNEAMSTWLAAPTVIGAPGKPEGFWVEIADVVIRLADLMAWLKMEPTNEPGEAVGMNIPYALMEAHACVTDLADCWAMGQGSPEGSALANYLLRYLFAFAREHHNDLWVAINLKHKYNMTRSFRHGNKKA